MVFAHTQDLEEIYLTKNVSFYCPLGKSDYEACFKINFKPDNVLLDYLDVEKYFKDIEGKDYIIEDAIKVVFDYFNNTLKPKKLKVVLEASSPVHFPVTVTKESIK